MLPVKSTVSKILQGHLHQQQTHLNVTHTFRVTGALIDTAVDSSTYMYENAVAKDDDASVDNFRRAKQTDESTAASTDKTDAIGVLP